MADAVMVAEGLGKRFGRDPESAGLAGLFPVIILFFTSSAALLAVTVPVPAAIVRYRHATSA